MTERRGNLAGSNLMDAVSDKSAMRQFEWVPWSLCHACFFLKSDFETQVGPYVCRSSLSLLTISTQVEINGFLLTTI